MADATTETHYILRLTETEGEELNALLSSVSRQKTTSLTDSQIATLTPVREALYHEISK